MIIDLERVRLRPIEPEDLDALYLQKNDPEIVRLLGGFTSGYSREGLVEWLKFHRGRPDEVIWAIAAPDGAACHGHVGLYRIDQRVRSAEFAVMIGDRRLWGGGIGRAVSRAVVEFGFDMLNLNRIELSVLGTNERAVRLYRALGFRQEGVRRSAQFKFGTYHDVVVMAVLRDEYSRDA